MDIMVYIFFLYSVVMALLVVGGAFYLLRKWYYNCHTDKTKGFVARVFRNYGSLRGWQLRNNVTVGEGDKAVVVDHLIIAPFGVIVACDLFQKGSVYGELQSPTWILTDGGEDGKEKRRETIAAPYCRARLAEEQLRILFGKNKIYSVPIEVIIPKTMKQKHFITGADAYMYNRKELHAQLTRVKYDKDNGVQVAQIAALFPEK